MRMDYCRNENEDMNYCRRDMNYCKNKDMNYHRNDICNVTSTVNFLCLAYKSFKMNMYFWK